MTRRELLAYCLALRIAGECTSEEKNWCTFHRYDRKADKWVKIDPRDIVSGDEIWISDSKCENVNGVYLVSHSEPDNEQLFSSYRIDPETNKWEPITE